MSNQMLMKSDPGSFKDPAGGVFYYGDRVCRVICGANRRFYSDLVGSDFFKNLMRAGYIISTWPVDLSHDSYLAEIYGNDTVYFEHEPIGWLSFPYEWSASMLIDAATRTLDLQGHLLEQNLSLKDATPYNIQFRGAQPIFIDLGSIENVSRNGVWIAYNQFCQMFLYPLLMFKLGASSLKAINLTHLNGLTLDGAVRALGFRPFFKYRLIMDYLIPAIITRLKQLKVMDVTKKTVSTSRILSNSVQIQLHTVRRLRKVMNKLQSTKGHSDWTDYTRSFSYSDEEYAKKKRFIESFFQKYPAKTVLDLGCNIGEFSIMAATHGCDVVALELDHDCVDNLYDNVKANKYSILPLHMDITNPSPSIGWFNKERPDFLKRMAGRFDCVFALALIHHLIISNRIPLKEIVKFFYWCTSRYLIVEYVGPSDIMFRELLKYRSESYKDFNKVNFERAFTTNFLIILKKELSFKEQGMERCLYLMEKER